MPLPLQNRALFEEERGRKGAENREEEGSPTKGQKGKPGHVKTGQDKYWRYTSNLYRSTPPICNLGVSQRPLTLILPQKYRDTNGRRIVIQIGGVYTTFCHREGIHLQKYAIEMGGVSRYFFTCIGVRGRLDSPDLEKGKRRSTPPTCTAVCLPFVPAVRLPFVPAILLRKYQGLGVPESS